MSKTLAFLISMACFPLIAFCQKNKLKQLPTFGVHFVLNDFETAASIRSRSLSAILREGKFGRIGDMSPGIALNYIQGLSGKIDLTSTLAGSFLDYPKHDTLYSGQKKLLLEGDVSIRARLFDNTYWFSPYFQAGAGISKYKSDWGAFIPSGAGLQINLTAEIYILINAQYRFPITQNTVSRHFYYSLGVAGIFGKKTGSRPQQSRVVQVPTIKPVDRDGDGILDDADECPDQPGMAIYQGCPDTDNDSIPDREDSCPMVFGVIRYNGCPVPDSDNDGINDEEDKCITVPGVASNAGCPPPDHDGDGIEDAFDKCPELAGIPGNNGCPEKVNEELRVAVDDAARSIFFATGSHRLLPTSYAALNKIVQVLADNPDLKASVEGHTDNTGGKVKNDWLSKARAKAVNDYLVSKGIEQSRLQFDGFGENRPVADNNTESGRAKNRRVEIRLRYE